ncbi:MAG: hypothetical protein ACHQRM_08635 [Bacteroidia bacterium]
MQLFITYLWWSVGIYDREHRKLNKPYTVCFLLSLALMGITLFAGNGWIRILFYLSLLLNYLPPFLAMLIVFTLWWIFFSMIADRTCKQGFLKSTLMSMVYIPSFMALGIMAVAFTKLPVSVGLLSDAFVLHMRTV